MSDFLFRKGEKHKIIFLDVDGVINIPPYMTFDQECLSNLKVLLEKTEAKIVISSSWRTGNLELTKQEFPKWMRKYIVGETIRGYHETIKGSSLPIERGNEIKHWVDRNLVYPWHAHGELTDEYRDKSSNKETSYLMTWNIPNIDFTYVIIDDDDDMLYQQKDYFVHTNYKNGFTKKDLNKALKILNHE